MMSDIAAYLRNFKLGEHMNAQDGKELDWRMAGTATSLAETISALSRELVNDTREEHLSTVVRIDKRGLSVVQTIRRSYHQQL